MSETVLVTGATGFVGRELLWRLARRPGQRIVCLIRAKDSKEAAGRLKEVLDKAQPLPLTAEERSRVEVVAADIGQERLGLPAIEWDRLATSVNRILHVAANVNWSQPLESARAMNVEGTRRVLELGRAAYETGALTKFDYVSTCHVCGKREGIILEEDLTDECGFFNTYEQSKFEAERLVRASGLPFATFRLPMVVGDSRTGYASTFRVMYWPLKMFSRGMLFAVPARPEGIADLVPVDYVCEALEAISANPAQRGKTFHLAAGPDSSSTVGELLRMAAKSFGVKPPFLIPPPVYSSFVKPFLYLVTWGRRRDVLTKGRIYVPYVSFAAIFDIAQTQAALAGTGLHPPHVEDYFQVLIDYAISSDWGKRQAAPVQAAEAAGRRT